MRVGSFVRVNQRGSLSRSPTSRFSISRSPELRRGNARRGISVSIVTTVNCAPTAMRDRSPIFHVTRPLLDDLHLLLANTPGKILSNGLADLGLNCYAKAFVTGFLAR